MADKDEIEIKIVTTVDGDSASKSIGDLKKEIKELESQMIEYSETNQKAFDEAAAKAGALKDKINNVREATNTLSASPIENMAKSFGGLGESMRNLDLEKFKFNFSALKTSFSDFGGSVLTGLRTSLSTTSGAFKLLGGAIAATGLGALVLIVVGMITHFDELSKAGGLIGNVFKFIGDMVAKASQYMKDFLDYLGLTDFKGTALHEKQVKQSEEITKQREKQAEIDKKLSEDKEARDKKAHEDFLKRLEEKRAAQLKHNQQVVELENQYWLDEEGKIKKKFDDQIALLNANNAIEKMLIDDIEAAKTEAVNQFYYNKAIKLEQDRLKQVKADQDALDEITANHELQTQLQNDFHVTQDQIDTAYEEAQKLDTDLKFSEFAENYRQDAEAHNAAEEEKLKKAKEVAEEEKQMQSDKLAAAQGAFTATVALTNAISSIETASYNAKRANVKKGSKEDIDLQKKHFKASKALAITNAAIQTAMAVIAAYTSGAAVPIIGVGLGPAMAAIAGVAGAVQIGVIASKKFQPEGGGSADTSAPPQPNMTIPSVSIPKAPEQASQFQASSFFGLGNNNLMGGDNSKDNRVYVVESDITNTQNRVRMIENRATLGG